MEFAIIKKPIKENFNETGTEEEFAVVSEHFLYLKELLKKNILIIAGPELNAKFGFSVIETKSEDEARKIMENDPVVKKRNNECKVVSFQSKLVKRQRLVQLRIKNE